MKRTAKYRMYPNKTQKRTLSDTLAVCCSIYNTCLEQRKMLLGDRNKRISRTEQQNQLTEAAREDPYLKKVHSQVRQDPTFRVQRAFDGFFRRVADPKCKNPGYPRFKSRRRYDSFTYPQATGFAIKLTRKLVDAYPYMKVERLRIDNMKRNHKLAKSISDASWGTLFFMLDYKAEGAGGLVERVDPRGTSQTCPCGEPVPKKLKDRVHRCKRCGFTADRDVASAMVISSRGDHPACLWRGW